jgi:hypothetical protein
MAMTFSLTPEPRHKLPEAGELGVNDLDGHGAFGSQVRCPVDCPHAAVPEQSFNPVFIVE